MILVVVTCWLESSNKSQRHTTWYSFYLSHSPPWGTRAPILHLASERCCCEVVAAPPECKARHVSPARAWRHTGQGGSSSSHTPKHRRSTPFIYKITRNLIVHTKSFLKAFFKGAKCNNLKEKFNSVLRKKTTAKKDRATGFMGNVAFRETASMVSLVSSNYTTSYTIAVTLLLWCRKRCMWHL